MPTKTGTRGSDTIDLRNELETPPDGWPAHQAWWIIDAKRGADVVYGSGYNDQISGGAGNDTLNGFAGNDSLDGGAGLDQLFGGTGDDTLHGGGGDDVLSGEAGDDWITGDNGKDKLSGGDGDDGLFGGAGRDVLSGDAGNDTLFGETGADTISGGAGSDILIGEAGNDIYTFDSLGFDIINEGVGASGGARTGTAYDRADRLVVAYTAADVEEKRQGDDLVISSKSDLAADGHIDHSVTIKNFFLGGHYVIEKLITSDHVTIDLTGLLVV
ncbi:calcium-binding protein [Rhizobium sp. YIM 134829]|uniref:calcium-binding protein n=1 Tax=Rhizobium sp. YIM 134829 TaxID=3390453 RepID=UPI00397DFF45